MVSPFDYCQYSKLQGKKKTLVLREIPEDGTKKLLTNKESLAACDVAVFEYNSSNEHSYKGATEFPSIVATQGEKTSFAIPYLLIAAKNDLNFNAKVNIDSTKICLSMGIDALELEGSRSE